MAKETKLGDDAYIYQPHEKKSEREKLNDMTTKGKLGYLWEYYKFPAFVTLIVVSVIIYFVFTMMNPGASTKFNAALVNNTIDPKILDQYSEEFSGNLQLDPKKEVVKFNYTYNFKADPDTASTMQQALIAFIQSGQVDVIIAPESVFKGYAYNGAFVELSDQLPTDIYSSLTNAFYLSDTEDNQEKKVYGIYLTDTKLYKTYADNSDPYILGILATSRHKDNSIEFIKYLFDEK